ncbi:hypothetical protein KQX54_012547 [Cotesia glomerata]|uniref:Uncharacterized protein n=1 Tax=Cotesia glomerata TaxID=32391 RepID=A0AAV7J5W8_COTGL|nr:hypothetical protein KQX54_012547 [Cotesia glomerata]
MATRAHGGLIAIMAKESARDRRIGKHHQTAFLDFPERQGRGSFSFCEALKPGHQHHRTVFSDGFALNRTSGLGLGLKPSHSYQYQTFQIVERNPEGYQTTEPVIRTSQSCILFVKPKGGHAIIPTGSIFHRCSPEADEEQEPKDIRAPCILGSGVLHVTIYASKYRWGYLTGASYSVLRREEEFR